MADNERLIQMRYPDANAANIAIVAIIGVIGGQTLALAFLAIIQGSAIFGWEWVATALLDGIVESAGAVAGICLVGFRFRVVGFGAVRAVGGIGLFIIAALSFLATESATWSISPNRIHGLLTNVLNLAYVLIGVGALGALGAWLRVLSARVIGPRRY